MDEFIVVKVMNEAMLRLKKNKNEDYSINERIRHGLEDRELFLKISKKEALMILSNVGVSNGKLEEMYEKLMAKKEK